MFSKVRRRRISSDPLDLGALALHASLDSRLIVVVAYLVEGRRVEGERALDIERAGGSEACWLVGKRGEATAAEYQKTCRREPGHAQNGPSCNWHTGKRSQGRDVMMHPIRVCVDL